MRRFVVGPGLVAATCATLGLAAAFSVSSAASGGWDRAFDIWLARGTGWCALGALSVALTATPAGRIARRLGVPDRWQRRLPATRRAFGITAGTLALLHAAIALGGYLDGSWEAVIEWPYLRAGLGATAILSALLVTSFPALAYRLRVKLWKPLHRLAYVAVLLVLEHLVLSPFAPRAIVLVLFSAIAAVGLGRLLPRPPKVGARATSARERDVPSQ